MSEITNTIKISAPISPYDTNDVQPTHEAKWGKGGHRSVQTLLERDMIPNERREVGMTVYVAETQRLYSLQPGITNDNWIDFNDLIAGSEESKFFISYNEPHNPKDNYAWLDKNTGGLKYRDPTNTFWVPAVSYSLDGGEF